MDNKDYKIEELKEKAREIRRDILIMLNKARSGHTGGSLSCVEILVTLYYRVMKIDRKNPEWEDRDRFVLSKGHAAPTLYAILADMGYISREELWTLRKVGSRLQGHPSSRLVPGVEISTGSLGQGLSIANGMAMALRLDGKSSHVFCLLGDGELQEGEIWEAAMTSSHYRLSNVTAIVDYNKIQLDDFVEKIMKVEPLGDKFRAFGWDVKEIDGHDFNALLETLSYEDYERERPLVVIAHTVKGKGVSFMENKVEFHGRAPTDEELKKALEELGYG